MHTAQLIQSICYSNKEWLSASIIIAWWDKYEGGQIYSCPLGATLAKNVPYAIGGSGSSYLYGYIDANFKSNQMEQKDARMFVRKAISHAIFRDGSSVFLFVFLFVMCSVIFFRFMCILILK